jgi:1,2-diacylglycerol 3-alpha-glucosyltransferase
MKPFTVAIQYFSFGPHHVSRLEAISEAAPHASTRVVGMEMFSKDSDYEWRPIPGRGTTFTRHTVMDCESEAGRSQPRALREAVLKALEEIRPDVLVVAGWGFLESRISLRWCRRNKCPIVMLNDNPRDNVQRTWWKEVAKRWLLRGIKAGFVAGSPQARYLERLGIPKAGIFQPGSCVVDNAYWASACERVRQDANAIRSRLDLPEKYFLCVARFIPCKNIPFLVRAYARYRKLAGSEAWGLVLCGSGPEEAAMRKAIHESGASDVHFAGFRQVDELPNYYGLAECFVLPSSVYEAWGMVVNEAMASGLPVLVSDMVGSAEDLVHDGRNGYIFDPSDEQKLAKFMLHLGRDDSVRQAMGIASRQIIEGHSLEVGAANFWRAVDAARMQNS